MVADVPLVVGLNALAGGGLGFGLFAILRSLLNRQLTVTKRTASRLLTTGQFELWNEYRELEASWRPTLSKLSIHMTALDSINLATCQLNDVTFESVSLTDAVFSRSEFRGVDFRESDLTGAVFSECKFHDVFFSKVRGDRATREGIELGLGRALAASEYVEVQPAILNEIEFDTLRQHLMAEPDLIDQLKRDQFEILLEGLVRQLGFQVARARVGNPALGWYFSASTLTTVPNDLLIDYLSVPTNREIGASSIRKIARRKTHGGYKRALFATNGSLNREAVNAASAYGVIPLDREALLATLSDDESLKMAVSDAEQFAS